MQKLFKYLKNYKLITIAGPLLKLAEALMETFVPLIMSYIINYGIKESDTSYIFKMGGVLVLIAILGWIFGISAQYFCAKSSMLFGMEVRNSLYAKILSLSQKSIDKFTIPSLITRTTNDVNRVQTGLNMMLRLMLRVPFIIVGAIIMSGVINIKIMFIYIASVPLIAFVTTAAVIISKKYYDKIQKLTDEIGTFCRENIMGVKSVRAFRMQKKESADFSLKTEELYNNQVKAEYYNASVNPLNTIIINICIILMLIIGAKMVDKEKLLNGDIIALVNYLMQILISVERTCSLIMAFNKAQASSARVNEVLDFVEEEAPKAPVTKENNENIVEFKNVSFSYAGASRDSVHNISFAIKNGESLGIIGGTGSGKSTIINLIQRLYEPTSGELISNGKISVCPQKSQLFKGTIKSNILFGNENSSEEELNNAIKMAAADEFVKDLGGPEYKVEYAGRNLSGGQRQRLTIARALINDADILILDDSTSALDFVTESKIRKTIIELSKFKAKIIVSQRISAVSLCDNILVLEDGKMAGYGKHEKLLEECDVYKEISKSQTGDLLLKEVAK